MKDDTAKALSDIVDNKSQVKLFQTFTREDWLAYAALGIIDLGCDNHFYREIMVLTDTSFYCPRCGDDEQSPLYELYLRINFDRLKECTKK